MITFRLLKALAAIVSLVLIIMGTNLHSSWLVSAASIADVSDTLSDTSPSTASNHTLVFTTPTGVNNGETITVDFAGGAFTGTSSITVNDIDVQAAATDLSVAANCTAADEVGVSFNGSVLTVEFCSGDGASIAAGGTTTIEIGTHATNGGSGSNQLINPASTGSYEISIAGTQADSGATEVVIIDTVTVSATVDTTFTFSVAGVDGNQMVNGATTTGSSTPTTLAFGTLSPNVASTTAQELQVVTNASQGYVVTVAQDSDFRSANGAIIDAFRDGSYVSTPSAWEAPAATPGNPTTFGHWGLTSTDATTTRALEFSSNTWIAASTTPTVIMSHTGPTDGTGEGEGTARVGYRVEISALQEAATDYSTQLRYVATPIF